MYCKTPRPLLAMPRVVSLSELVWESGWVRAKSLTFHQSKENKDQYNSSRRNVCAEEVDHWSPCTPLARTAALTIAFPRRRVTTAPRCPGLLWRSHAYSKQPNAGVRASRL